MQHVKFTVECEASVYENREDIYDFVDLSVDIAGVKVLLIDLPKYLQDAILEVAMENADERAWV